MGKNNVPGGRYWEPGIEDINENVPDDEINELPDELTFADMK